MKSQIYLSFSLLQRHTHQSDDYIVGKSAKGEPHQSFLRIQSQTEHRGGTTGNLTPIDALYLQDCSQVATDGTRSEANAIRTGLGRTKSLPVDIVVLLYRTPVVGIGQRQGVGGAVGVGCDDDTVGNMALHVVGGTRQQQPGFGGFPLQRHRNAVGIVVPQGGIDDILSYSWGAEGYACHTEDAALNLRSEHGIVDFGRIEGMTPLSYPLYGNLQGGN